MGRSIPREDPQRAGVMNHTVSSCLPDNLGHWGHEVAGSLAKPQEILSMLLERR